MSAEAQERFQTLHELVKAARFKLNANIWDYLVGATETETTMRRNRAALDSIAFRPRVLRNVGRVDSSGDFLGRRIRLPVILAPVGSLDSFEPGGAATAGRAAAAFGVPIMVSSVTEPGLERSAEAVGDGPKVFQLYVRGGPDFVDDHVKRAMDSGYDAFAITVDTAHYSRRERDIAKRFVKHWRARSTGMNHQAELSWTDIARFREKHPGVTLILKGIGTGEDAEIAVQHGVQVVYVSNHGGRQLDHGREARCAEQAEAGLHLVLQQFQHPPHPVLARGGQAVAIEPPYADHLGAERDRLHQVRAAADPAIHPDARLAADGLHHFRQHL